MQQFPNIPIPQDDDSQLSRPYRRGKNILSVSKKWKNICLIITLILGVLLIVAMRLVGKEETGYVKECEIFDCENEIKAVGKRDVSSVLPAKEPPAKEPPAKEPQQYQISSTQRWQIDKIIWMFKSQKPQKTSPQKQIFKKLNLQNTNYFATFSDYQTQTFTLSNYTQYLSQKSIKQITTVQQSLYLAKQSSTTPKHIHQQISQNQQSILKRLITYLLLLEHGGVFIDDSVTIVEPFQNWLETILKIPYINVGDRLNLQKIKPKCFGFFDNDYSSIRAKVNVMREYEFERKLVVFPALEEGFLACEKGTEFMSKLIEVYVEVLTKGTESDKLALLNKKQKLIGKTDSAKIYQDGHILASHIVLQQRQAQLLNSKKTTLNSTTNTKAIATSEKQSSDPFISLAIDSFGLITLNNNIGPHKFKHIFLYQQKCYSYLTKLPIQEMEQTMGKVRFIAKLTPYVQWKLGRHLIEGSKKEEYFVEGSFMHQYFLRFLPNDQAELQKEYNLKTLPEIINYHTDPSTNAQNPQWTTLPNTVWVIWDKGLKRHSKPIIQLCYQNLKKSALASNFSINIISNKNIDQFISKELQEKIRESISKASQPISSQTLSDFWRLAVMYENGGVYVDASTFTTDQNFDWIKNITRAPSNMLWNRYGTEPEVFIFWNSLLGCPANWHYDTERKTKVQWHLSYESNFIAAVKHSEFVKEWLEVFMEWITLPYDKIFQQMSDVGMESHKWTKTKDRYLLVMDAVKYVAGRREKLIRQQKDSKYQSAADYYKIWSLPGQMIGQQKFRGQYNFESRDYRLDYMDQEILNLYKTQYPWWYAQELLGSFAYQTKFFGLDLRQSEFLFDNFYRDNAKNFTMKRFQQIIHPQSVFGKLLFFKNPQFTAKLMKYYNETAVTRLELKAVKMAGL